MSSVKCESHRSALAKFRYGVAPINIGLGRYVDTPPKQRTCSKCPYSVETEIHVLLECKLYSDLRCVLNETANTCVNDFYDLSVYDKFCLIMNHHYLQIFCAKTCFLILQRRRNLDYN